MDHARVIETISEAMAEVDGVRGLFLGGSYGTGRQDDYSDIDFVLVSEAGATDAVAAAWRQAVARTGEIVLWWDRVTVPVLINAITEDWNRTDVMILTPDQMGRHTRHSLKPLFDTDGLYEDLPADRPGPPPDPAAFRGQAEEFIRVLGLLDLVMGRAEYLNGVLGLFHLRNKLVELMIQETGAPDRGGMLHLNRLITDDQKAVLTALPPPVPERDALIEAHLAYAAAYLPRARARAAAIGADWPERFEAATWAKLRATLSVTRPY